MKALVLIVQFGQNRLVWETSEYPVSLVRLFYSQLICMGRDFFFPLLCEIHSTIRLLFNCILFLIFHIFSPKWSYHLQFHLLCCSVAFTWNGHSFVLQKTLPFIASYLYVDSFGKALSPIIYFTFSSSSLS